MYIFEIKGSKTVRLKKKRHTDVFVRNKGNTVFVLKSKGCTVVYIGKQGLHTAQWYEFEIKGYTVVLCFTFEIRKNSKTRSFRKITL